MSTPTNMADAQATDPTPAPPADAPILGGEVVQGAPENVENGQSPAPDSVPVTTTRTAESYELTVPEGASMDKATLDEIAAYAAERGLSDEVAQDLVKFRAETAQSAQDKAVQANTESLKELRQQWRDSLQSDPQFGGDNMPKTVEQAKRALERFGSPELRKTLNDTGLGDHKDLIIAFARVGAQMAEDTLVTGSFVAPQTQKSVAEKLYSGTPKE